VADEQRREQLRGQRIDAEAERARAERRQRTLKLGGAIGLAAVLAVVVLIVVSQSGDKGGDTDIESSNVPELAGLAQEGDTIGDPGAPVTVVEFGDLQCPVCKAYSEQVVPSLLSGPVANGEAKLQFRNWVIIGPESRDAAAAALAAGEQNKLWDFVTLFYENQGTENSGYVTDDFLRAIAEDAGLDVERWEPDRAVSRWESELQAVDAEASNLGFNGTPSILVRGPGGEEPLRGVPSASQVEDAIAQLSG
jgi:protein-disulfide isomerase